MLQEMENIRRALNSRAVSLRYGSSLLIVSLGRNKLTPHGLFLPSWLMLENGSSLPSKQGGGGVHPAVLSFIVLSGYCIHRNGFRAGSFDIKKYFTRRFFRIYPLYLLATLLGGVCYLWSSSIDAAMTQKLTATAELSLFAGISRVLCLSAFIPSLHTVTFQGNAPLHTVMVEIWLYVAYPFIAYWTMRKNKESLFWKLLIITWVLGSCASQFTQQMGWWNNGSFFSFLLFWWIGAKFVDASFFERVHRYRYLLLASWMVCTLFLVQDLVKISALKFLSSEMRKVLFAFSIGWAFVLLDRSAARVWVLLAWIGKPGYSLYAVHGPVTILMLIQGFPWWQAAAAACLVALIFYWAFESRLTRLGKTLSTIRPKKVMAERHS